MYMCFIFWGEGGGVGIECLFVVLDNKVSVNEVFLYWLKVYS